MHLEARAFLDYCYRQFGFMYHGTVLDVGSGDINGSNRDYFARSSATYIGCDVAPGRNVDVVSPCHMLPYSPDSFNVVISSECFEHDMHYAQSIRKIVELLKPGGLFVFTCASTGRPEHGTLRTSAGCSFSTRLVNDPTWGNYYKNLTESDIRAVVPIEMYFTYHRFYYNDLSKDLYFVGIKKPAEFTAPGVV